MDTVRQQKISKLIQKELGILLQQKYTYINNKGLLTLTVARVSADLSSVRAYVSIFGPNDKKLVLKALNDTSKEIRYDLGQIIKLQVRIIPQIKFFLDDSLDYAEKIDNLLKR